ncbi:MAG: sugar transferase [Ruminococcaceae bacterium]|nr:sugar transferase [Oscillospiraceae bacterium]
MSLSRKKTKNNRSGSSFDTHSYDLPSKELYDRLAEMQPEIERVCAEVPKKRLFSFIKRVFDIVFSVIALILLSPLFLVISIAVRRSGPGGAIFRQPRVGLRGKVFTMYKFRTMTENAESMLPDIVERNVGIGPMFKDPNDPRLTPLGEMLRRYSIDELPQLVNILRGEMSFVGPRPPLVSEVVQYKPEETVRLSVIGGLTCSWQVHRKREADFYECLAYDKEYIEKRSLFLDLLLILQTFGVVSKGEGR